MGLETYLPLFLAKHQWSDRQRVIQLPLFAGYVFVRITPNLSARILVLRTNGVIRFVGCRGGASVIPDDEIEAVRAVLAHQVPFESYPFIRIGQRVRVRGGSLDGIQGVLTAIKGEQSLSLSVELLQRSITIQITGYRVEAI
jgi:transcription antitermination factor NusG